MSRPKPNVLNEVTGKDYKVDQVLKADGIWTVFYDNSPINLKTFNMLVQYPGPKYKKVSFSNSGHAVNLAKKLNKQFNSDLFTVVVMTESVEFYPNDLSNG